MLTAVIGDKGKHIRPIDVGLPMSSGTTPTASNQPIVRDIKNRLNEVLFERREE
jgi:hypothetical protein